MKRGLGIAVVVMLASWGAPSLGWAKTSIVTTKHNLSSSGPGEIRAMTEDRICIFCHTPHNATPQTPLWNRKITEGTNYLTYDSTTFHVKMSQPTGPSRLCLSCHDGTVALGAVLSVSGGIAMTRELTSRSSNLGTDLRNDHPFSFSYHDSQPFNTELQAAPPTDLQFYNGDAIHCSTCHDAHSDQFGMFLAVDNQNSALCLRCHNLRDWPLSVHATATKSWDGTGLDPWPLNSRLASANQRHTVAANGCENCHKPHNAGGPQRLMTYLEEEKNCYLACHNGKVTEPGKNILAQTQKISAHRGTEYAIGDGSGRAHDPTEDAATLNGHVECQDCHNPHSAKHQASQPPAVSGSLARVKGVDENGLAQEAASNEYEICYKCHGDSNTDSTTVNRYQKKQNTRLAFARGNPSYHPVTAVGKNRNVPSVPSSTAVEQTMNDASMIYCTDCHSSDESVAGSSGPNGPHGSIYAPILRERYERVVGTTESYEVYALCYRCHERSSILNDVSFRKRFTSGLGGHSGHLAAGGGTPCSVCHDPHGVAADPLSGDHSKLINFDSLVVRPVAGQTSPLYTEKGNFSGSCTLICHGVTHDGSVQFTYP